MAAFDPNEMITRFRDRATAVRKRPLPPIAGEERQLFIANSETDFRDLQSLAMLLPHWKTGFLHCVLI